jgi:hypothetical protein
VDGGILDDVTQNDSNNVNPEIASIIADSGNITGHIRAFGGDIDEVHCHAGNIAGTIQANSGKIRLVDADGDLSGDLLATNGDIEDVVVGGDLLGDINATGGRIHTIDVAGSAGVLGGASVSILSDGVIDEIIIGESCHAIIDTDPVNSLGNFRKLRILGVNGSAGDFEGSLYTRTINAGLGVVDPGIYVAGDLEASLTFTEIVQEPIVIEGNGSAAISISNRLHEEGSIYIGGDLQAGIDVDGDILSLVSIEGDLDANVAIESASLPATGAIIVGGDLNGDIVITDTAGLEGFITIGSSPLATTDPWGGDVVVGAYTIGKYYTNPIAQLGGGAVGIVPDWGFHSGDCFPEGSSVCEASSFPDDSTVIISHYGPIDDTVYDDLLIERKPLAGGSWTDITSGFEFSFDAGGPRDLLIDPTTGSWDPGYHYRVTHEEGDLQIPADVLVGESNVDVGSYVYTFCILSP